MRVCDGVQCRLLRRILLMNVTNCLQDTEQVLSSYENKCAAVNCAPSRMNVELRHIIQMRSRLLYFNAGRLACDEERRKEASKWSKEVWLGTRHVSSPSPIPKNLF